MIWNEVFNNTLDESFTPTTGTAVPAAVRLVQLLEARGLPARVVSVERAGEIRDEIAGRRERREFDDVFDHEALSELSFTPPHELRRARSIVVAAVPRPETEAVFHADGRERTLKIPPTYTDYHAVARCWLSWLRQILAPGGYRAAPTALPLKLLAVRSGLAYYGRNNITYVPGLGSYFELVAAFTDIPCDEDDWREETMLDRCLNCHACANRCPTQAIRPDRFLLHTERCLVFHNERPADVAFPEWIEPSAHHAVIGCMECQSVCPENRAVKKQVERRERFNGEETAMILAGTRPEDLPHMTNAKLGRLDLLRFIDLLPRNVGAALAGSDGARARQT